MVVGLRTSVGGRFLASRAGACRGCQHLRLPRGGRRGTIVLAGDVIPGNRVVDRHEVLRHRLGPGRGIHEPGKALLERSAPLLGEGELIAQLLLQPAALLSLPLALFAQLRQGKPRRLGSAVGILEFADSGCLLVREVLGTRGAILKRHKFG